MRPTQLNFRSPKEQTGEFLCPGITYTGANLQHVTFYRGKTTFPRSARFQHITESVKKTSYRVGPGSYRVPMTTNKGLGPKLLRESVIKDGQMDYFYVGNILVKQHNGMNNSFEASSQRGRLNQSMRDDSPDRHWGAGDQSPQNIKPNNRKNASLDRNRLPAVDQSMLSSKKKNNNGEEVSSPVRPPTSGNKQRPNNDYDDSVLKNLNRGGTPKHSGAGEIKPEVRQEILNKMYLAKDQPQ